MSLMSNLYKMNSGLKTSQMGLYVTSHNMANAETRGYTRQRITQSDSSYATIGYRGDTALKVGSGVDVDSLQQIRDNLLDKTYRQQTSKIQYYVAKENTIGELETILGEINGETLGYQMNNLWKTINTLSTHPEGIETRTSFLQTAVTFIDKANDIYNKMSEYQYNLNSQIQSTVKDINNISEEIAKYNKLIAKYEAGGDSANDYRDQRNILLDELSGYGDIIIKEDLSGQVNVIFEGNTLVSQGDFQRIGLQYENTGDGQSFVKPVWTSRTDILGADEPAQSLYSKSELQNTSADRKTDIGLLRGLLVSRGDTTANKDTPDADIRGFIIPTAQKEFDILIDKITSMLNDIVTGDTSTGQPPYDLYGNNTDNEPIFVTIDGTNNFRAGNIKVNQELLHNPSKLALSVNGEAGDNTLIESILKKWKETDGEFSPECSAVGNKQNFENYYAQFIARIGDIGSSATRMIDNESIALNKTENDRQSVSGVSIDEEMANMIVYQHAYNASAKIYNVIDSMLDTIINRM